MDPNLDEAKAQRNAKRKQPPPPKDSPEGASKTKRQRVSRACDGCRRTRDRCDGKLACQTCLNTGRECTYTNNPKKRGIPPGYIRALESSLALLFVRDPGNSKYLLGQLSANGMLPRALKDSVQGDEIHAHWSGSPVCKQLETLLSGSPSGETELKGDESSNPTHASPSHVSPPGDILRPTAGGSAMQHAIPAVRYDQSRDRNGKSKLTTSHPHHTNPDLLPQKHPLPMPPPPPAPHATTLGIPPGTYNPTSTGLTPQQWIYPDQSLEPSSYPGRPPSNQGTLSPGHSDGISPDFDAIFADMAQLNEPGQFGDGSQFMQNLGLVPNDEPHGLFGSDFHEPDPLLAYLQYDGPRTAEPGLGAYAYPT